MLSYLSLLKPQHSSLHSSFQMPILSSNAPDLPLCSSLPQVLSQHSLEIFLCSHCPPFAHFFYCIASRIIWNIIHSFVCWWVTIFFPSLHSQMNHRICKTEKQLNYAPWLLTLPVPLEIDFPCFQRGDEKIQLRKVMVGLFPQPLKPLCSICAPHPSIIFRKALSFLLCA